jgi:hypothetical protein
MKCAPTNPTVAKTIVTGAHQELAAPAATTPRNIPSAPAKDALPANARTFHDKGQAAVAFQLESGHGQLNSLSKPAMRRPPRREGWPSCFTSPDYGCALGDSQDARICQADDFAPPTWPTGERPQQFHLDVTVDDVDAVEPRVLALGATKHAVQPGEVAGDTFRVYLDPAGHPFCFCWD